jgi:hypothetical protein
LKCDLTKIKHLLWLEDYERNMKKSDENENMFDIFNAVTAKELHSITGVSLEKIEKFLKRFRVDRI